MKAEDAPMTTPDTDGSPTDAEAPVEDVVRIPAPEAPRGDPSRIVEAALFSSGKPITVDEIAENTGLGKRAVKSALKTLVREYEEGDTALEVAESGKGKWAMQVKAMYTQATHRLAPMEIPVRVLKTLALIAYHQPILQSDLVDLVGAKAYDHVRELYERGLIKRRVHDRSFMLLTNDKFPEYFGIPASDREEIKRFLANKLGINIPDADTSGNKRITSFQEGGAGETAGTGDEGGTDAPAGETAAAPDGDAPDASPDADPQDAEPARETEEAGTAPAPDEPQARDAEATEDAQDAGAAGAEDPDDSEAADRADEA